MSATPPVVDAATVRHVARLARLGVDDATLAVIGPQLGAIIEMMTSLSAVDTTGIAPAVLSGVETRYRAPDTGVEWAPAAHLENAPESQGTAFRVPRVV
ncbi:aspartyl/glutamyl-tRNA amidotransferase subunit C [Myxococcota bacterium]|nr:aspartyl/glutamyl-tRNA amidotransferase subunit C [Myxococcota bacterium]